MVQDSCRPSTKLRPHQGEQEDRDIYNIIPQPFLKGDRGEAWVRMPMFDTDMCLTRQARSGLTRGSHQKIVYCNFSTKRQWRSHHLTPQKRPNLTVPHMVQESCSSSSEAAGPFLSPPLCWALQGADSAAQVSRAAAHGYLSPLSPTTCSAQQTRNVRRATILAYTRKKTDYLKPRG